MNDEVYSQHKCAGCGRNVIHKHCPAYGTPFYCSGIGFSEALEKVIDALKYAGLDDADKLLYLLMKIGKKDDTQREDDSRREV